MGGKDFECVCEPKADYSASSDAIIKKIGELLLDIKNNKNSWDILNCKEEEILSVHISYPMYYRKDIVINGLLKDTLNIISFFNPVYSYDIAHNELHKYFRNGNVLLKYEEVEIFLGLFLSGDYSHNISLFTKTEYEPQLKNFVKLINDSHPSNLKNCCLNYNLEIVEFEKKYTWDDIVLDPQIKIEIERHIIKVLKDSAFNNITKKRGVLLEGPPGTGKTLLGKIIASVCGCTFIGVPASALEKNNAMRAYFRMAQELAPTILYIEDIDLIGRDRTTNFMHSTLGELLNQIDGLSTKQDVVIVATTNDKDILDEALKNRPGRFDRILKFDYCNNGIAMDVFNLNMKDYNCSNEIYKEIENKLKTYSKLTPAHIREICILLKMCAVEKAESEDRKENKQLDMDIVETVFKDLQTKNKGMIGF